MAHPFMAAVADGLAERNVATLRYQFPYMEEGSKRPDVPKVAQATRGQELQSEDNDWAMIIHTDCAKSGGRLRWLILEFDFSIITREISAASRCQIANWRTDRSAELPSGDLARYLERSIQFNGEPDAGFISNNPHGRRCRRRPPFEGN
jgi:hypothetical protein